MEWLSIFFLLLVGHALADMALQSDGMAKGKNRHRKPDYVPKGQKFVHCWPYFLSGHALIHGGAVYLITNNLWLGIIETVAHWLIDFGKCENWTNPHQDQAMHILCKAIYVVV